MAYQRRGRLLVPIKTQVIPISDLGLPIGGVEGLQYPDDLPPVLAVNVIQTPTGPRIVQGDSNGHLLQTQPKATQVNIVPSRTDAASVDLGPYPTPAFSVGRLYISVTAISGSGATITVSIIGVNSKGTGTLSAGGAAASAITTATDGGVGFGGPNTAAATMLPPLYIIRAVIAGTTPSITWYADLNYK